VKENLKSHTQSDVSLEGKRTLVLCNIYTVRTVDVPRVASLEAERSTSDGRFKDTGRMMLPLVSAYTSGSKRTDELSLLWSCICKESEAKAKNHVLKNEAHGSRRISKPFFIMQRISNMWLDQFVNSSFQRTFVHFYATEFCKHEYPGLPPWIIIVRFLSL